MSLTQAEMDCLDETPTIRNVPAVMSVRPLRAGEWEARTRRPSWRNAAERRKRQLANMAAQLEMEEVASRAS